MSGYTVKDVIKVVGVSRDRFNAWVFHGFVKSSVEQADGRRGKANIYSKADVYFIATFKLLLDKGFNRQVAADLVNHMRKNSDYNMVQKAKFLIYRIASRSTYALSLQEDVLINHEEGLVAGVVGIKDGLIHAPYPEGFGPDSEWEFVGVINFKRIRNHVDAALG